MRLYHIISYKSYNSKIPQKLNYFFYNISYLAILYSLLSISKFMPHLFHRIFQKEKASTYAIIVSFNDLLYLIQLRNWTLNLRLYVVYVT